MKFNDELREFVSSGDDEMTQDVLDDNEDLLHQLSAELGIPDFLEDSSYHRYSDGENDRLACPSSPATQNLSGGLGGLGTGLLDDHMMDMNDSLFPDITSSSDSAYSGSIKSEPTSPFGVLPPSPTSSDNSDASRRDSPPPPTYSYSPTLASPDPAPTLLLGADGTMKLISKPAQQQTPLPIQGLAGKIAIPKIRKPAPPQTQAPLVLQLSNDGLYYTKTTSASTATPLIVKTEPACSFSSSTSSSSTFCNPLVAGGLPTVTSSGTEEVRNLKRQQRMIKNRESACISRKKKKEYVTNLEDQIKALSSENNLLRNENENLKEKVRELENEKKLWTSSILNSSNGTKKATAAFAFLLIVSLNVSNLSTIKSSSPLARDGLSPVKSGARTLLSTFERDPYAEDYSEGGVESVGEEFSSNFTFGSDSPTPMCRMFQNQTESIRLESELRGWFNLEPETPMFKLDLESPKRRPDSTSRPTSKPKRPRKEVPVPSNPLGRVIKRPKVDPAPNPRSVYRMLVQEPTEGPSQAVGMYDNAPPRHTFASFFDAIDRRDDTFYVVSFSGDHLLVPATNHSQANRPRMSLLLPAMQVSLNESHRGPQGSLTMMKIDCEVMNTQLLHVHTDALPPDMAANLRHANLSNDEKKSEGEDFAAAEKAEEEEVTRRTVFARNYRNSKRTEMENQEKDNVTVDAADPADNEILDGVPELGKHFKLAQAEDRNQRNSRKKRKSGGGVL